MRKKRRSPRILFVLLACAAACLPVAGARAGGGNPEPVILVPGFLEAPGMMSVLAARLQREGNFVVDERNVLRGVVNIRLSAMKLAERVERVKEETGAKKVDLVGHSEGGLVSRYYIQRLGGDRSVDDYVSLGTPHEGTVLAYLLFINTAARQMTPTSLFLRDLNAPDCTPGDAEYTAIYSRFDELVIPYGNGAYPDDSAVNRLVTWPVLHVELLFDPTVADWVNDALD